MSTRQWPAPWWYRLALRFIPGRCREVPEATDPDTILLRQVAIWTKHAYLQQFASGENLKWMHSHPYRFMIAIGLWGSYIETRMTGPTRIRRAPYLFFLDNRDMHHVTDPARSHTSIFIGLGRKTDDKHYFEYPPRIKIHWRKHIQKMVKRI